MTEPYHGSTERSVPPSQSTSTRRLPYLPDLAHSQNTHSKPVDSFQSSLSATAPPLSQKNNNLQVIQDMKVIDIGRNGSGDPFSTLQIPSTPIPGYDTTPTLNHIPPSPETNGDRFESIAPAETSENAFLTTGKLTERRGSKDTQDSLVSGTTHSETGYSDQRHSPNRTFGEGDQGHARGASESKSGGISALGFFRRKRRQASSTSPTTQMPANQTTFSPPESAQVEGYSFGDSPVEHGSDKTSKEGEESGRASISLGRTSLRRKGSALRSVSRTKQGFDRLALGIEQALSLKHRNHDRDASDMEGGYASTDSRLPTAEKDGTIGLGFGNSSVSTESRINQAQSANMVAALPPVPHDISRRRSAMLLDELNNALPSGEKSGSVQLKPIDVSAANRTSVSPDISPKAQISGLPSTRMTSQDLYGLSRYGATPTTAMMTPSETFHALGSQNESGKTRTRQHTTDDTQKPARPAGLNYDNSSNPSAADIPRRYQSGPIQTLPGDAENIPAKINKHARSHTTAFQPSFAAPEQSDRLSDMQEVLPPERKSSRAQLDGAITLGASRSRTLTVPDRREGNSDSALSEGERKIRTKSAGHRSKTDDIPRRGSESANERFAVGYEHTDRAERRQAKVMVEKIEVSATDLSGNELLDIGSQQKTRRSSKRYQVHDSQDKEDRSETPHPEGSSNRSGHTRGKCSTDAIKKKRSSGGKPSRSKEKEREKDREVRLSRSQDARREKIFSFPSAQVEIAPKTAMYWSMMAQQGQLPEKAFRSHSGTVVGQKIYVLGGCDKEGCYRGVSTFNTESHVWARLCTTGVTFPPLRAHTTTAVDTTLYIFGGGNGPAYSNDVWTFDTLHSKWAKPNVITPKNSWPLQRRAHTTVHYKNFLVIFGGGNGQTALNDVWALDIADPDALTWTEWKATGDVPVEKGYHTANLVAGHKMVVYGGSDGTRSFGDIHVLNLETMVWTQVDTEVKFGRLSHSSTVVGSYLFIVGGHDGHKYTQEVLLFNLVSLSWETKPIYGKLPVGRGYHATVLHDHRLVVIGGYNGYSHFDTMISLDLASHSYLPQVTSFSVDEVSKRLIESKE